MDRPLSTRDPKYWCAIVVACSAFAFLLLEAYFGRTFLTTPLPRLVQMSAALVGAAVGAWVWCVVMLAQLKPSIRQSVWKRSAALVSLGLLGMVTGLIFATPAMWRAANIYLFWNSAAPITVTAFPILSVRESRRGRLSVTTGGSGLEPGYVISRADYRLLGGKGHLRRPWKFCLNLRRQEQGQAVRVWKPAKPRDAEQVTIVPCPASVRWVRPAVRMVSRHHIPATLSV